MKKYKKYREPMDFEKLYKSMTDQRIETSVSDRSGYKQIFEVGKRRGKWEESRRFREGIKKALECLSNIYDAEDNCMGDSPAADHLRDLLR